MEHNDIYREDLFRFDYATYDIKKIIETVPQAIYDYHYGIEAEQYAYFRIPKLLMTEPHFKDISTDAKLLYGLMLDRMGLSVKNGWQSNGNIQGFRGIFYGKRKDWERV